MLLVILHARPGKEIELERELRALIVPTRQEEGCLRYSLYGAPEGGAIGTFLFYEVWRTREAHTLHTQTPHFKRFSERKDELVEARDSAFWKQIA
ncbi:MAG: antibiotic biosynthesis monooxygenase [Acidobacteriia bacterium]|nr:antibiotic biosynthesis monooxygenase [Terriglobia bacterium]